MVPTYCSFSVTVMLLVSGISDGDIAPVKRQLRVGHHLVRADAEHPRPGSRSCRAAPAGRPAPRSCSVRTSVAGCRRRAPAAGATGSVRSAAASAASAASACIGAVGCDERLSNCVGGGSCGIGTLCTCGGCLLGPPRSRATRCSAQQASSIAAPTSDRGRSIRLWRARVPVATATGAVAGCGPAIGGRDHPAGRSQQPTDADQHVPRLTNGRSTG